MLDYALIKNWVFPDVVQSFADRDTILYALGLGMGTDPLAPTDLPFVYERELKAVPTQAAVLGSAGFIWQNPAFGVDWVKIVHGEQDIEWYRPLPTSGTVVGRNRVVGLTDKGAGKGVLAHVVRDLSDQASGDRIAQVRQIAFLRGDGGYSADNGVSDPPPPPLPQITGDFGPARSRGRAPTLPQSALIYRLSGDYNPLHADPAVARAAGYERPILHGLCTYGMAARALLGTVLDNDPPGSVAWRRDLPRPSFRARPSPSSYGTASGNRIALRAPRHGPRQDGTRPRLCRD